MPEAVTGGGGHQRRHAGGGIGRRQGAVHGGAHQGHDFALLAARKEDPDTLFFSRRLVMEGDTELGLLVKNTLDAIEQPLFSLDGLLPRRPGAPRRAHHGGTHG